MLKKTLIVGAVLGLVLALSNFRCSSHVVLNDGVNFSLWLGERDLTPEVVPLSNKEEWDMNKGSEGIKDSGGAPDSSLEPGLGNDRHKDEARNGE